MFYQAWISECILAWSNKPPESFQHTRLKNSSQKDDMSWLQNTSNEMVWVFLSSRKFFVSTDHIFSDAGILNCDVLQGSIILGLLLLLIYFDDFSQLLLERSSYLYTDETCVLHQGKDIHKIDDVLSKEFSTHYERFVTDSNWGKIKRSASSFLKLSILQGQI